MQERILPRHFISMEEDIVLVCRKSKISMQEGREVEGKSVMRLKNNIIYYFQCLCACLCPYLFAVRLVTPKILKEILKIFTYHACLVMFRYQTKTIAACFVDKHSSSATSDTRLNIFAILLSWHSLTLTCNLHDLKTNFVCLFTFE